MMDWPSFWAGMVTGQFITMIIMLIVELTEKRR